MKPSPWRYRPSHTLTSLSLLILLATSAIDLRSQSTLDLLDASRVSRDDQLITTRGYIIYSTATGIAPTADNPPTVHCSWSSQPASPLVTATRVNAYG